MHSHTCHVALTNSVMCFQNMHWGHTIFHSSHHEDKLEKGVLSKYEPLTQIRSLKCFIPKYWNIYWSHWDIMHVQTSEKFRLCQRGYLSMCYACFPSLHFWIVTFFIQQIFMEHLLCSSYCTSKHFLWILSLSVRISGNSFKNVFLRKYSWHTLLY